MNPPQRSARAKPYPIRSWRDMTPMNVSMGTMLHNLTGQWRFIRPLYEDKTPACQDACPAGSDIEGWIKLLEKKDMAAAFWHLKAEQPFPAVLGRVCPAFCQRACNRSFLDECVGIRSLERFIGDRFDPVPRHPGLPPSNNKALAVVGSGPAGMAAAYFGSLLGFTVTLFESHAEMGGLLRYGIPAYRLPRDVVAREFDGLSRMGVRLRPGTTVGKDLSFKDLQTGFDFIFLAIGAHQSLSLGLENDAASSRVMSGLALLKAAAEGRPPDLGKKVVVIGGGNTALDAARTARRMGAEVTVVYRRTEAEMPAFPEEIRDAREEGVLFIFLAAPEQIDLSDDGGIARLVCSRMTPGEPDADGRRRPLRIPGDRIDLFPDTILTAVGETPDLGGLAGDIGSVNGLIPTDGMLRVTGPDTGSAEIFAGGDAINFPRTVVHAVAAGKKAAIAMDCQRKGASPDQTLAAIAAGKGGGVRFSAYAGRLPVNPVKQNPRAVVDAEKIVYDYFSKKPAMPVSTLSPARRISSFDPYTETWNERAAAEEASRCLHCGRCTECDNCLIFCPDLSVMKEQKGAFGYRIDYDYCKGCGICFTECPRHAISIIQEETVEHSGEAPAGETGH